MTRPHLQARLSHLELRLPFDRPESTPHKPDRDPTLLDDALVPVCAFAADDRSEKKNPK